MSPMLTEKLLSRWLRYEATDDRLSTSGRSSGMAERALGELLSALPLHDPGARFAERVLLATRATLTAAHLSNSAFLAGEWLRHWGARAAVALCAVQAGLLVAAAVGVARPILSTVSPLGLLTALASLSARALEWLAELPRVGIGIVEMGQAIERGASSPSLHAALLFCVLSSAVGLFLLSTLIPGQARAVREPT